MWFLALAALAGPQSPVGMQNSPLSLEVAGNLSVARYFQRAYPGECDGENCTALRIESTQGGQVDLRIVRQLGVYGAFGHAHEATAAADYAGDGWTASAGVKASLPLRPALGIDAWAGLTAVRTTNGVAASDSTYARTLRTLADLGVVVHGGSVDDDIIGWVGAEAVPFAQDSTILVEHDLDVAMVPGTPAGLSATAGFMFVSSPLGAAWSERGRIGLGASGSAGYRTGLQLWLSGAF